MERPGLIAPPWPTLWIAAGRRSAAFTKLVRERSEGKTFTVQILDPRIDPRHWDAVLAPAHDGLEGPNVLLAYAEVVQQVARTLVEPWFDRFQLADVLGLEFATVREMIDILTRTYCSTLGVEFMHISDPEEKGWIAQHFGVTIPDDAVDDDLLDGLVVAGTVTLGAPRRDEVARFVELSE